MTGLTIIPADRPAYRILSSFYGPNDHLYQEDDCIVWEGEPNEEMEPLNVPARKAMGEFFDKLEDGARAVAEKAGRTYAGRPRSLDEAIAMASADARRVQTMPGGPGVPLMGGHKINSPRIEKIEAEEIPQTGKAPTRKVRPGLNLSAPGEG